MLESYMDRGLDRLFANVDVTETVTGEELKDVIRMHYKSMPKHNRSYKSKNGSYVEVIFNDNECTVKFWYRSWRYVNSHFYLDLEKAQETARKRREYY